MKRALLLVAAVVLLMTMLVSFASAAAVATPFNGTMTGQEAREFDFPNNRFFVSGQGSGTATQLGKYTFTYAVEVNMITGDSTNGTATFVAANGDLIFAEGTGHGDVVGNVATIREWFTITGGTGRFEGASGSYTMYRDALMDSGETWGYFEGSIMTPNGK